MRKDECMGLVEEARNFCKQMAEEYGAPPFPHTEFVVKKGQELAKKLHADESIVIAGCYLMDIELGRALKEGKQKEHVKMGVEIAGPFLDKLNTDSKTKEKILNCIAAHHGEVPHTCIESEIVKNADNFRFLDPTGAMISLFYHAKDWSFDQSIGILRQKLEEKHALVTLDICKGEAEEDYRLVKAFLDKIV